jgi:PAS domain S-box-containing protein
MGSLTFPGLRPVFSLLAGGFAALRHPVRYRARALEEARSTREGLELSERRVRELLDAISEGLVTVDTEGLITWANRGLCEMMGYPLEEILGRHPTEFLDEENRRVFRAEFGSRRSGERRRYEIDWIRKDGSLLRSLVAPQPLYEPGGGFAGSVSVIADITALKEVERALRASERQFRELVDYASSIVLRWGTDGTIHFINRFGVTFFGYREEEILGRNVLGTIVPLRDSSGADLSDMIADIGAHPDRYLFNENEVQDRAGNRSWVVWTNRGLLDDAGMLTEVLSIGTDITELKKARVALAHQRDELVELNQFVRGVFGRYVSQAVMRNLLDSPEGLEVGGTTRRVTILVADVRGFSSICADLEPQQVIALLNTYLEVMTTVIEEYDGTIDEFIGDAILVLFGAPLATGDHARRAVACALAMQLAMDGVNERNRARGLPALEIGIGIHTGEVVVGNIGSLRRAKYGAVGASVNLASRLESYTVGGQILVSDSTRAAVGEDLILGSCLRVEPKGAQHPLAVHEVLGLGGEDSLTLPARRDSLRPLAVGLDCEYCVMEEKFVGRTAFRGSITKLSRTGAEMRCETPPPLLSNLRLRLLIDGHAGPGEIYAKVVGAGDDPLHVGLHFTSTAPEARKSVEERLG